MKRLLLSIVAAALASFCIVACARKEETHTHVFIRREAVAATCSSVGNVAYDECSVCGKKFDVDGNELTDVTVPIDKNAHKLSVVEAKAATCSSVGNVGYGHCLVCEKNFASDGITEITDVTLAKDPTNHSELGELISAVARTCVSDGSVAHYRCDGCGKDVAEDGKTILVDIADRDGPVNHSFTDVPAEESTCTARGVVAHKHCTLCEKNFNDDGEELLSVEAPLKNHSSDEWLCDESKHYKTCSVCSQKFDEAEHSFGNAEEDEIKSAHYYECEICGYRKREKHNLDAGGVCSGCFTERAVWNKTYSGVTVTTDGRISVAKNRIFAFDESGTSRGAKGAVFAYTDGIEDVYDENGVLSGRNLISDTVITVRYSDKATGRITLAYSYNVAKEKTAKGGEWGEPSRVVAEISGYIDASSGVVFLPSDGDDSILLLPSDVPVTAESFESFIFDAAADNSFYIEYDFTGGKFGLFCKCTANDEIAEAYVGVTVTDFDCNAVAAADFSKAKAMIIKDRNGKALAKYGFDGENVVELDRFAGKYDGDLGKILLDGLGNAMVSGKSGRYIVAEAENHNLEIYICGDDGKTIIGFYEILADASEYVYTVVRAE